MLPMTDRITPFEALQRACDIAGSQSALARICNVAQPSAWKWFQSSKRLPPEHVLAVEAATGVDRHLLRPDIYPLPRGEAAPSLPGVATTPDTVSCGRRPFLHAKRA